MSSTDGTSGFCKDCFRGSIHSGTPKGHTTRVHGLDAYVTEPPSGSPPKGIVVIIPDLFGWEFSNSRCLADDYARKGNFLVYLPDFQKGNAPSPKLLGLMDKVMAPGFWANIKKIFYIPLVMYHMIPAMYLCRPSVSKSYVFDFFSTLRENEGKTLPVGAAGFCWGGKFVTLLTHDAIKAPNGLSLIDAGFTGHPSMLKVPADIEPVKLPLSIAVGPEDMALGSKNLAIAQTVLDKKVDVETQVVVYDGAKHGFCVRGNENDEKEYKQGIEAEDQAISWFSRWFGQWRGLSA